MTVCCKSRGLGGFLVRWLLTLLIAACAPYFAHAATSQAPAAPNIAPSGPAASFAVADFDGDSHPDTASVQAGENDSASGDYWVRLHLSASGRSYIRVAAPSGGLRIEARDVNGDNAVDLVLLAAWRSQPVAVLLNDGHGNFSQVDVSAYRQSFERSQFSWQSMTDHDREIAGMPQDSRPDAFGKSAILNDPAAQQGSVCFARAQLPPSSLLFVARGRAPPSYSLL